MNLPKNYEQKIIKIFGKYGHDFLNNIDNIIQKNSKIYNLTDFKVVNNLTYNLVMTAFSKKYGDVIVKIGLPDKESIQEIIALNIFNGHFACKCYEHNFEDCFYILERLKPASNLLEIKDKDKRIEIFCDLVKQLPVKFDTNLKINLPNFREKLNVAFSKARKDAESYKEIIDLIEIADEEYKKIENLGLDKYVLHGDLHHGNIVLHNNQYKAIDPHGVIGENILEIGCFIENEIWLFDKSVENIKDVIKKVATNMNASEKDIAQATFIRMVLSAAWSAEEKEWRLVDINEGICREVLKIM